MLSHLLFLQAEVPARTPGGGGLGGFLREFWPVLVPALLALAAVYLLLPRVRRFPLLWGGLLAALAVLVAGFWLIRFRVVSPETVLFYIFSFLAVVFGGLLVTQSNPVHAALSFALVVLSTCGLFLLLAAPFLMAATVIIYAGAIVVTFLFVIMLAQQLGVSGADQRSREPFLSCLAGFVLLAALLCVLQRAYDTAGARAAAQALEPYLDIVRRAKDAQDLDRLREVIGDGKVLKEFREQLDAHEDAPPDTAGAREAATFDLSEAQIALAGHAKDEADARDQLKKATGHLRSAYEEALSVYHRLATVSTLPPDGKLPLSPFSQGRPGEPAPRDERGRVVLPAENVAALGRSLFTDYLLAVEVAGLLLTVATIGAIAIAARGKEELR
jgi:NADH:ubiquinone oxidoreductase subunit 6 (subunit J)